MSIGSRCFSRSSCRTCFGVSPSIRPLRSRPCASSAVYSNAPIGSILASNAQDFLERGFALHDFPAAVVADAGTRRAGVALEILFGRAVVNHGPHMVIDRNQLIN